MKPFTRLLISLHEVLSSTQLSVSLAGLPGTLSGPPGGFRVMIESYDDAYGDDAAPAAAGPSMGDAGAAGIEPPPAPTDPGGFHVQNPETVLTRPMRAASWWPEAAPRAEPLPGTGHRAELPGEIEH